MYNDILLMYHISIQHVGSSIKVAWLSSRHILAFESNAKFFDEVLKPLKESLIVSTNSNLDNDNDDMELEDDSSPLIDKPFNDLCE